MPTYTPPPGDALDLLFDGLYSPPAGDALALVFGESGGASGPTITGTLAGVVPPPGARFVGRWLQSGGSLTAQIPGPQAAFSGHVAKYSVPDLLPTFGGRWQQAAPARAGIAASWLPPARLRADPRAEWGRGAKAVATMAIGHRETDRLRQRAGIAFGHGAARQAAMRERFSELARRRVEASAPWGLAVPRQAEAISPWIELLPRRHERVATWSVTTPVGRLWLMPSQVAAPVRTIIRVIPWDEARRPAPGISPRPGVPPPFPHYLPPPGDAVHLLFCDFLRADRLNLVFGRTCADLVGGLPIPIRRVYLVIHDIEVVRLPDLTPIPASQVQLSLDADAWAWNFSATLLGKDALDAVLPSSLGEPVTLQISLDGHVWQVLVEDWSEDREFGRRGIRVRGRGLSAWLGAPYELPGDGVTDSAMTIQQVMNARLPIGGDWTIDWATTAPDWLVPAGAWTWQGRTPIQAIHEAATGTGLVLVPGMADRTLTVQPRYPVLPWAFAAAAPDLVIPDAAIVSLQRRQATASQANAVFVYGGNTGGVMGRVYLGGSAGDRVAPAQSQTLITHVDAARLLGGRILAANFQQPQVRSVTIPLGGVFPLAAIGQLARIDLGADPHRGIVNGIAIAAQTGNGEAKVRQTITVGEDSPNQWAAFRRLLPGDPLLAGEITADHGDGTVSVALSGGGTLRVRGSGGIGAKVWVRSGRIEGEAPGMTAVDIEV